jgi:ABC-type transport system involved in multi-copper enzyme maturation permease subunit
MKPALWYEAKLALGWSALLPSLGLPIYVGLTRWLFLTAPSAASAEMLAQSFVILLPLVSALSAAHLMTIEQEEGIVELRASYPEPPARLPLVRGMLALGLLVSNALVGLLAFRLIWGPLHSVAVLPALLPALFLSGLSLLTGRLARSYWVAAGLALVYWFFELHALTKGITLTNLLIHFFPVICVSRNNEFIQVAKC